VDVKARAGFVSGGIANLEGTPGFRELLIDLQNSGNEVALHTPDHFTTKPAVLKRAFASMAADFRLRTWIDHGYDNASKSNREDLVCDGFMPGSKFRLAGLFEQYGVRNVWNCFYEDSSMYASASFNSELLAPHPAFGKAYPQRVRWTHSSVTGSVRHFATTCTTDPASPGMWSYYINRNRLEFLCRERGMVFMHCYPSRIDSSGSYFDWHNPVWTITPEFDQVLATLEAFRDAGRIWIPTVDEFMEYQQSLDAISFSLDAGGNALVRNTGSTPVKGLSFSVLAKEVSVPGKVIEKKNVDGYLVFWFDLLPEETVTIKAVK
jgi:hypothetical protein